MRNEVAVGRKLHCESAITKKKVALLRYKDANVRYYGSPFMEGLKNNNNKSHCIFLSQNSDFFPQNSIFFSQFCLFFRIVLI